MYNNIETLSVSDEEITSIIEDTADIQILKGVDSKDHIHMYLEYRPSQDISTMVKLLKGRSSRKLQMEFPELKEKAMEHYREWEPDAFVVEAKASGAPLIYELRAMGIPVQEFTPTRGNDKIVRINSVSDLFSSGKVWAPATRWAEEVIEEMASFPNSDHDDLVDSSTQALIRFRKGGFLRLPSDEEDEVRSFRRKVAYY